jgi:hypothetical protein
MAVGIIVKNYDHFNRSLGMRITSKKHYEDTLKRKGMVSYEKSCELASKDEARRENVKVEFSPKAQALIEAAKQSTDRKGNLKCGSRLIDGMKELGVAFNHKDRPKNINMQGGFGK